MIIDVNAVQTLETCSRFFQNADTSSHFHIFFWTCVIIRPCE